MIRSKNIMHTLQLFIGVILAIYFLVNLNSLQGLRQVGEGIPEATIEMTSSLSTIGDDFQKLSQEGFLQSVVSTVVGDGESTSSSKDVKVESNSKPKEVVEDVPTTKSSDEPVGNFGEWITAAGDWLAGIWVSGEETFISLTSRDVHKEEQVDEPEKMYLSEEFELAVEPFSHLSRPYISNVPVRSDEVDSANQPETDMIV